MTTKSVGGFMKTFIFFLWELLGINPDFINIHSSRVPKFNRKMKSQRKAIKKAALEKEYLFDVEFEETFAIDAKPAYGQYDVEQEDTPTGAVPVDATAKHPSAKKFENLALKKIKNSY